MLERFLFILLLVSFTYPVYAQILPQETPQQTPSTLFDRESKKYGTSLERMYRTKSITRMTSVQVLEDILDEISYEVGPGDVFQIHVWGELESEFIVTVTPQGTVLIPTVGELQVNRLNLQAAKKKIEEAISAKYRSGEFSINLIELRKFRVYITGEVTLPGTYFAQASDRISDVLEVAEGVTDWADNNRIEVRHIDKTVDHIDLNKFFMDGDKSNNPYLRGGDVIYIPGINIEDGFVIVEGNVELGGILQVGTASLFGVYVLKENETIYNFMHRIGALTKKADLRKIAVVRQDEKILINLLDVEANQADFILQNADRIIIPSIIDRVYVRGEVRMPGSFSYFANQRAKDYVGKAGVLNSGSGPEDYVVIRYTTGEYLRGPNVIIHSGDTIIVPTSGRYVLRDYIVIITPILGLTVTLLLLITTL